MAADSVAVHLDGSVVTVATGAGPRVLGYGRTGDEPLFARLPEAVIEHPAVGRFHFLGGHRLWRAPEVAAVTYQPDDDGATVEATGEGVVLTGAPDGDGVVKRITLTGRAALTLGGSAALTLGRVAGVTVVDHELRNTGTSPVEAAPWAITQLAVGGTAILPQATRAADPDGVRPNRHLVLWPYTDPAAPEVSFAAGTIRITASSSPAKLKLGWPNRRGWLAYALGGLLFVKWAPVHDDGAVYADLGASAQCYRDDRFLELETLGPLTTIAPGDIATHREVWTLIDLGDADPDDGRIDDVLADILADLPETHPELTR